MESQPLVSILINNYNYGRFLKEAIESALNQTYPRIEVIVVDDGSTDNSREIISSYGDRIVSILKENGGQASAFNAGFAASQGNVICFLDADDLFKPEKSGTVVKDFQKNPEISWHFHLLDFFGSQAVNNEKKSDSTLSESPDLSGSYDLSIYMRRGKLRGSLPFELNIATSGMCFQRSFLNKILPMSEDIRITSDDYIKYAALGITKGFISFKPLAQQRLHDNNAYTKKPTIENGLLRARVQILTAYHLKKNFPNLSRFSDNLVAMGIKMSWWIGSSGIELSNLIKVYLQTTTLSEKIRIYIKAVYHHIIGMISGISN